MTNKEKQQIELKNLMESPTTPVELKDQIRKYGLEGTIKYNRDQAMKQFYTGDIFSNGPSVEEPFEDWYKSR